MLRIKVGGTHEHASPTENGGPLPSGQMVSPGFKAAHKSLGDVSGSEIHSQMATIYLQNKSIFIASDNTTVVAYINIQGGTCSHSLLKVTTHHLLWCQKYQIDIRAHHIAGHLNVIADRLSRFSTVSSSFQDLEETKELVQGKDVANSTSLAVSGLVPTIAPVVGGPTEISAL